MALIDYQAHNFTCYTVPECPNDENDGEADDDEQETEVEDHGDRDLYGSRYSLASTETTSSSIDNNILRKHHHNRIKYQKKFFNPYVNHQRASMPLMPMAGIPQLGSFHYVNCIESETAAPNSPQLGYFVPFSPNCYFSPPVERKRTRDKENERNRRAVSYGGITNSSSVTTLPRAAPRRMNLMKEPPPPPPPKPILLQQASVQSASTTTTTSTLSIPSKYPQSEYNLIQKLDSTSTLTAPSQYQAQNFYANTATIATHCGGVAVGGSGGGGSNYSSLLCHSSSTTSPLAVRKREKLLHRFSDAATLGRKLKKKKNTNRTCRSMTEAIEMLADPVIEDEFFVSTIINIFYITFM